METTPGPETVAPVDHKNKHLFSKFLNPNLKGNGWLICNLCPHNAKDGAAFPKIDVQWLGDGKFLLCNKGGDLINLQGNVKRHMKQRHPKQQTDSISGWTAAASQLPTRSSDTVNHSGHRQDNPGYQVNLQEEVAESTRLPQENIRNVRAAERCIREKKNLGDTRQIADEENDLADEGNFDADNAADEGNNGADNAADEGNNTANEGNDAGDEGNAAAAEETDAGENDAAAEETDTSPYVLMRRLKRAEEQIKVFEKERQIVDKERDDLRDKLQTTEIRYKVMKELASEQLHSAVEKSVGYHDQVKVFQRFLLNQGGADESASAANALKALARNVVSNGAAAAAKPRAASKRKAKDVYEGQERVNVTSKAPFWGERCQWKPVRPSGGRQSCKPKNEAGEVLMRRCVDEKGKDVYLCHHHKILMQNRIGDVQERPNSRKRARMSGSGRKDEVEEARDDEDEAEEARDDEDEDGEAGDGEDEAEEAGDAEDEAEEAGEDEDEAEEAGEDKDEAEEAGEDKDEAEEAGDDEDEDGGNKKGEEGDDDEEENRRKDVTVEEEELYDTAVVEEEQAPLDERVDQDGRKEVADQDGGAQDNAPMGEEGSDVYPRGKEENTAAKKAKKAKKGRGAKKSCETPLPVTRARRAVFPSRYSLS